MACCSGDPGSGSATGSSAPPFLVIPWEPGSGKRFGRQPALAHFANGTFYPLVRRQERGQGQRAHAARGSAAAQGLGDLTPQARRVQAGVGKDVRPRPLRAWLAGAPALRLAGAVRIWRRCLRGVWPWPRPGPGDAPPPTGAPPLAPPAHARFPGPAPGRAPPPMPHSQAPRGGPALRPPRAPRRRSEARTLPPLGDQPAASPGQLSPGRPGPAPGTDTRYGAHLCASLRGPSAPCRAPHPARGFVRLGRSAIRGVGAGGGGSVPGRTGLLWGGRGRGPRSGVGCFALAFSADLAASLLCLRGAADRGALLSPLMRRAGPSAVQDKLFTCQGPSSCCARPPLPLPPIRDGASCALSIPSVASQALPLNPEGWRAANPGPVRSWLA